MVKVKRTKVQTKMYKTLHIKQDRATRTPLKIGGELRSSERVGSSCSTNDTRHVNLATNPVISHERGKDQFHQLHIVSYIQLNEKAKVVLL
jgi:hypothetical protein